MRVLPSINEKTFAEVKKRLKDVEKVFKDVPADDRWVHFDVSDGRFTKHISWNNPSEFEKLKTQNSPPKADQPRAEKLKYEVHLMVEHPEDVSGAWLLAGADRVIVHIEAMKEQTESCLCGSAMALAVKSDTAPEKLARCAECAEHILILAVPPGPSGQSFDEKALQTITFLREKLPNVKIEVDGGMNPETARLVKERGADSIVSGGYMWESRDPAKAYRELTEI